MVKVQDSKASKIKTALQSGDYVTAYKIAAAFWFGFSKDEKRAIDIANQSKTHRAFYEGLDVDVDECIEQAKQILINKFLKDE